jgi:hypothetical protein
VQNGGGTHPRFRGSFESLLRWARKEHFLGGQHARVVESKAITHLRNTIAHPERFHVCMPVDSARTIRDVAEFINRLWGHPTPGGRLYPAPVARRPRVVARSIDGQSATCLHPEDLTELASHPDAERWNSGSSPRLGETDKWAFTVVRCPDGLDPLMFAIRSELDRAPLPIDVVFGPSGLADAVQAWTDHTDEWGPDTVETLDRTFLVRLEGSQGPEWPLTPPQARLLRGDARKGRWLVVIADVPHDALGHAQKLDTPGHTRVDGVCDDCRVDARGLFRTLEGALRVADALG